MQICAENTFNSPQRKGQSKTACLIADLRLLPAPKPTLASL